MAISPRLRNEIEQALELSESGLSRRASRLIQDHGPMSPDEARWILAHEAGIDLRKHRLTDQELDRVRQLRNAIGASGLVRGAKDAGPKTSTGDTGSSRAADSRVPTRSTRINGRELHSAIVRSSKKLYVDGHPSDAIRKAFQSVNNRVKKLSGITGKNGRRLMAEAFRDTMPALQMSGLRTTSEADEHEGLRFAAMGGIAAMRNPRSHDNEWPRDANDSFVLDALSFASLLHRFLDSCEEYRSQS